MPSWVTQLLTLTDVDMVWARTKGRPRNFAQDRVGLDGDIQMDLPAPPAYAEPMEPEPDEEAGAKNICLHSDVMLSNRYPRTQHKINSF